MPHKLGGRLKEVEKTSINEHCKINIYFTALDNIINYTSERFKQHIVYVINYMQDFILNDKLDINYFK